MKHHVTMQQIADEAGVSTATVSRVLTGQGLVGSATRERVQALIDKYHYTPNSVARTLVRKQSNMLGMLVQDIGNPYFSTLYLEAERYAIEQGYTLLISSSLTFDSEKIALQRMREWQVDGVIMISSSIDWTDRNPQVLDCILAMQKNVPMVLINEPIDDFDIPFVVANNYQGYRTAMDHLFSLGHRDIAFVGGMNNNTTMQLRHDAYSDAYRARGLTPDPVMTRMLGYGHEDGKQAMMQILSSVRVPTAVLCANDVTAMGVLNVCRTQRLDIPGDVSVVSCDNTFIAEASSPGLTSIDVAPGAQGVTAIRELIDLIRGEEIPQVTYVPSNLVIRGSTGKAVRRDI